MEKWVKLIKSDETTTITDIEGLIYLDFNEEDVQTTFNTQEIKGVDGLLVGSSSFAPFKLVLNFVYSGVDVHDYHLFKMKLRRILYQREPYYVIHSDMPGKKYAVLPESTGIEDKFGRNGTFEITFTCYKGYSESVNTTDSEFLFSSEWQFDNGLTLDFNPKYHHNSNQFTIWNGSSDTIDPRMRHELKIRLNLDAIDGFEIVNYTTGDSFKYFKSIDKSTSFVIDGVYAYRNDNRVGIDTNRGIITLAPGKNEIRIKGNVSNISAIFKFPFIYR